MYRYPDDCSSDAEWFCMQEREWLDETARREALKRELKNHAEDIVQEIFRRAKQVTNESWTGVVDKKGYLARMVMNYAEDVRRKNHDYVALTDTAASTSPQSMEAGLLIEELYQMLSDDEQTLLELVFEQYSGAEIAKRLFIEPAAARKRVSRLLKKLNLMSAGKQVSFRAELQGQKQVNPVL